MVQRGFAERLRSRLKALGYWKHDRPDVARFALERAYRPQYVYAWLRDRIPDYENLLRLAQDLRVAPDWLRSGDQADDQAVAAVSGLLPENRRGPAPPPPGPKSARPKSEPGPAASAGRVIEHPLLRLHELSEKLSTADARLQDAIRALAESEERFRHVFEEGPLGMGIADAERRLVKVNRRLCEMLGYREEELIGGSCLDFTHPDDRPSTLEMHARMQRKEIPYGQIEKRYVTKKGEIRFANVTVFLISDDRGTLRYHIAMIDDITERKRMEEELRRVSLQQQRILESVTDGLYGTDEQRLVCFVNPAAVRLMGWEPEELLGQTIHDFVHRARPDGTPYPKHECPVYASKNQKTLLRMEHDLWWRKDGTTIAVDFVRAPIIENGKVVGAVVTFRKSDHRPSDARQPGTRSSAGDARRPPAEKRPRPPKTKRR